MQVWGSDRKGDLLDVSLGESNSLCSIAFFIASVFSVGFLVDDRDTGLPSALVKYNCL